MEFKAKKQAFLIVKANYENPFVQFSVKTSQIIPDWAWMLIIIGSSVLYFALLLIGMIFLTKYLTMKKLKEM